MWAWGGDLQLDMGVDGSTGEVKDVPCALFMAAMKPNDSGK